MLITLLSFVLAILTTFYFEFYPIVPNFPFLATLMLIGGTVILVLTPLMYTLALIPIQNLDQQLIPRLTDLFYWDRPLRISRFFLLLFALVSYVLASLLILLIIPHKITLFALWIFLFGGALDLIRDSLKHISNLLNPFHLVEIFKREAKKAIQDERDEVLWESLDTLSEVILRAIEKSRTALCTHTLNAFPPIMHTFFATAKSISHVNIDKEVEKKTGKDEASYTLFYLIQRLQAITNHAINHQLETICSHIIVILGKIIVYSAQFDLSMVSFPTNFLGKMALKAQQHDMDEVSNLATSTLLEISRTILTDMDLTYAELQDPFQAIINDLDILAKETFRKDKTVNIQLLTQPFKDLKALFQTEKMAHHRDTASVIQSIDQVLAQFNALEQIMRTLPPIPDLSNPTP